MEAARANLKLRYSLLKFYYRHFINKRGSGTIFRPLFIDFYNDPTTFNDDIAETQFMIGEELMFAPIVTENVTYRSVYFPIGSNWYDYQTGRMYKSGDLVAIQNALNQTIPVFLR
jgi:alpha-glucosidase (family GH31 glycosyl hydrolase)